MMTLCLCFLGYLTNNAALKFDVVSIVLSVCFICYCVLGAEGRFGFWSFCRVCHMPKIDDFIGASL